MNGVLIVIAVLMLGSGIEIITIFARIAEREWRVSRMNKEVIIDIENPKDNDAISRQAVNEIVNDIRNYISVEGYLAILERLKKLPPVRPQE